MSTLLLLPLCFLGRFAEIRGTVKQLTGGRGADVIFDPVGGAVFDESMYCGAYGCRLLVVRAVHTLDVPWAAELIEQLLVASNSSNACAHSLSPPAPPTPPAEEKGDEGETAAQVLRSSVELLWAAYLQLRSAYATPHESAAAVASFRRYCRLAASKTVAAASSCGALVAPFSAARL